MKRYGERRRLPPRGPLRKIIGFERGAVFEYDVLECGHLKEIGPDAGVERRRCDECRREAEREANTQ